MSDLTINTDLARSILTGFIHSETTRAGFSKAVIGVSGGIDSALSCYLQLKHWAGRTCWPSACPTRPPVRNHWITHSW